MNSASKREVLRILSNVLGFLYVSVGVIVTVLVTFVNDLLGKVLILALGLLVGMVGYYVDAIRGARRKTKEQLRPLLEEIFLPKVINKYHSVLGKETTPEIRANVMLLERRDFPIPTGERKLAPWKRSLQVDFSHGDYDPESRLKWGIDEGVCGTVIEYNKALHSDLEDVEIHEWDMTPRQLRETEHLGSVLSIPIYRLNDEEKNDPIGVLNLDSEANISETHFDDSELKESLKKYASYVGRTL